jgi:hypothetical protein
MDMTPEDECSSKQRQRPDHEIGSLDRHTHRPQGGPQSPEGEGGDQAYLDCAPPRCRRRPAPVEHQKSEARRQEDRRLGSDHPDHPPTGDESYGDVEAAHPQENRAPEPTPVHWIAQAVVDSPKASTRPLQSLTTSSRCP